MTSKQLGLPERLPERGSSAPMGEIGLKIEAEYLELTVEAVPGLTRATADLSGPQEVLDRIIETREGNVWSFTWPKDGRGRGGGIVIQSGGFQSVSIGGGVRGRMTVNGVDITDLVNNAAGEPLRAKFRVPARSALVAKVDSGSISVNGPLVGVRANTVSADVECTGQTGQLNVTTISGDISSEETGPAIVGSTSGDIRIQGARGTVQVQTVSGDISVHALDSVIVTGNSVSGDVRVTANPGANPSASGNSVSGRVRLPR